MPEALTLFHFIRPWWLLGVLPALLLAWYWARRRRADSHWESTIAPELLQVLLERGSRRRARYLPWLAGLSLAAAAVGLAGPTWERLPQPVERKTDALVILFDLSLSMFAEDVAPTRLVRARQKIADVLRRRDEGFTALVAYAGDAHSVVPLTDDVRTIENLLTSLRPDMMPVLGSNLAEALEQAQVLFDNARVGQGRILVVTDSVDDAGEVSGHRDPRFPVSILGVGTEAGATIPLDFVNQPGQVLRNQQGEPVVARLDPGQLSSVTDLTYGRYHTLTLSDDDIQHLLTTPLPGDDDTTEVERQFDTWSDKGYWIAVLLLPLVLGGFRRGMLILVPLLLVPPPVHAGLWDDLWQRRDQQAYQALQEGQPEAAAALFEEQDWRAAALYRSEEFAAAAESYRRQSSTTALYNLGNALARQQDYDAALDAYEEVLAREPEHQDALHNKALLERLKEEQEAQQQEQQANQQQGSDQPEQQSQQENGEGDPGQDDPAQQGQSPEDEQPLTGEEPQPDQTRENDTGEKLAASRDEKQEALEQWLRRVPDDPGGLLRRKFQYETNQRLRRGDYRSQETEQIW